MAVPERLAAVPDEHTCDCGPAAPARLARFVNRVARLRPGKYVLTLTVTEERTFWTIQEMGRVEG